MWRLFLAWLGFGVWPQGRSGGGIRGQVPHGPQRHGHAHGTVDASIETTERGIWAIGVFWSTAAPQEPHEFEAKLMLRALDRSEEISFRMVEPSHA